jgi:hypothetical protein
VVLFTTAAISQRRAAMSLDGARETQVRPFIHAFCLF